MASRRSEPQSGERPAVENDGRTSRDEGSSVHHTEDRGETYGDPDVVLDVLTVKGVEAQAQLKARLDNVRAIFSEVLESLQHSPQFFRQALETGTQTAGPPEDTMPDTEVVDETGDVSGPPAGGGAEERGEPEATEAARNKARELGVDLSGLEGTGSGGRIIVRDVAKAARG